MLSESGKIVHMTATSSPSRTARVLAVLAILLSGLCGGFIGYRVTILQCSEGCTTLAGFVGLLSAVGCAIGVAIVAVLALRASGEWNAKQVHQSDQSDNLKHRST